MKFLVLYTLLAVVIFGFTSVKPVDDLKLDWKRLTDKDYVVSYIKVQYDSSSQYAIDTKVRIFNTNEGARLFSKSSVKLLKELILETDNFSEEDPDEICKASYFPYAIVVTRHGQVEGVISIGCDEKVWCFEPRIPDGEIEALNEKGLKLKEEIFKSIR